MKSLVFVGERYCASCEAQMEILNSIWIKLTFEGRPIAALRVVSNGWRFVSNYKKTAVFYWSKWSETQRGCRMEIWWFWCLNGRLSNRLHKGNTETIRTSWCVVFRNHKVLVLWKIHIHLILISLLHSNNLGKIVIFNIFNNTSEQRSGRGTHLQFSYSSNMIHRKQKWTIFKNIRNIPHSL